MKENFDHCLEMLLEHEGGYVNHPSDPGGETNLGVTKRVWEDWGGTKDMKELTPEDVAPLYKQLYWDKIKGDELPSGVDWCVFDWGVNSGTSRSAKALQRIVGTRDDGHIGPKTMELVMEADVHEIINKMYQERQEFYEKLKTFDTFGKGWTRRNKETLAQSLEMV
jgi:lysozyme family protein